MSTERLLNPLPRGRGLRAVTLLLTWLPLALAMVLVWAAGVRIAAWRRAKHVLERFAETDSHAEPGVTETTRDELFFYATKANDMLRWSEICPTQPRATLLLVHGVNYKGIQEPRLLRFARALAHEGVCVYLPELPELADYRIDPRSIDRIGLVAARAAVASGGPVGVIGTSFAGGLSVMAAARDDYAPSIKFVFSLGGHEDVDRVSRYLATGEIEDPFGQGSPVPPHDYGMLVLLHSHARRFFPAAEVTAAEQTITAWLHEDRDEARVFLRGIGDATVRDQLSELMERGKRGPWSARVLHDLETHHEESRSVSPLAIFPKLHKPVYLLHGTGDSVIPAVESMHFAYDAPSVTERVLISPAIVHVEVGKGPNVFDQLQLVDFLADVLLHAEP